MEYIAREPPIKKEFQDVIIPVSYTHLDVYKRQGINNAVKIPHAINAPMFGITIPLKKAPNF